MIQRIRGLLIELLAGNDITVLINTELRIDRTNKGAVISTAKKPKFIITSNFWVSVNKDMYDNWDGITDYLEILEKASELVKKGDVPDND